MTSLQDILSPAAVDAVGWTLLHSLWQGIGVAVLLVAALVLLRRRSANARHGAACAAMVLMLAAPIVTLTVLSDSRDSVKAGAPISAPPGTSGLPVGQPTGSNPANQIGETAPPTSAHRLSVASSPATSERAASPDRPSARLEASLPWVVLAWLSGVLILSVRLIGGWVQMQRLRHLRTSQVAESWQETLNRLVRRLCVSRPVRLLESALAEVPLAIGWLRPVILLPASALTGLSPRQLEAVLAHELAHIRRNDYLVNIFQTVVETVLFYHPAVWWISHRIRAERENCCDDLAVAACGDALVFARALTELEQMRGATGRVAVGATGGTLLKRVRRLVAAPAAHSNRPPGWLAGALALLAAIGISSGAWLARSAHAALASQEKVQAPADDPLYKPIPAVRGPTTTITGVVVDEEGRPAGGVLVLALSVDHDGNEGPRRQVRTDVDGEFIFENLEPEGTWCFSVDDPRFAKQWERETFLTLPVDRLDSPMRLRLHRPRTLPGVVVDETATPVSGVTVTLVREYLPDSTHPVQGWLAFDLQVSTSDGAGRFRLERLRPGKVVLMLDHSDFARTITEFVEVPSAEARVTIKKGLTLRGRVVADGKPLAGVGVAVRTPRLAHRSLGEWSITTNSSGEFTVEHMTASYRNIDLVAVVSVEESAWTSAIYQIYQIDENTLPFVEVEAQSGTTEPSQRGLVRVGYPDPAAEAKAKHQPTGDAAIEVKLDGEIKDAWGRLRRIRISLGSGESERSIRRSRRLDDGGTVVFRKLPAGTYRVSALNYGDSSENYLTETVAVGDGQTAKVVLRKGPGRISGVLRSGGVAISLEGKWFGILCEALESDPFSRVSSFRGELYQDGSYEIDGVPFGRYEVVVYLPSSWANRFPVNVEGAETKLDIDLPTGRILGRIAEENAPAHASPHRSVTMYRHEPREALLGPTATHEVDAEGRFEVRHVPPGTYSLFKGRLRGTAQVSATDDEVRVELRLPEKTGWIGGTIAGLPEARGGGSLYVLLTALRQDEWGSNVVDQYAAKLDRQSSAYRFEDLPVGTYAVCVGDPPAVPLVWIPDIEVRENLLRALDIVIPEGRALRVTLANGERPSRAVWWIRLSTGERIPCSHSFGSSGHGLIYDFKLPFGDYVLEADFGESVRVRHPFTVVPGEGVQEVVVGTP